MPDAPVTVGRALEVRLFGQAAIVADGQPFRLATPRKSLQVLAYLLMHRAAHVSRDYLAFLVWPDEDEERARARLRSTISDLLRVLPQPGSDFIGTSTDEVWWNNDVNLWLDVDAFVEASQDAARLEEALALYRGDLLPELYDEWIYGFRERFRNIYSTVLAQLVSETRRRGDLTRAIELARLILQTDPWREDIVRRIVALRYELGDAAGAISEYRRFAARLREEMDVDPMPETVALAERITKGDAIAQDGPDTEPAREPRPQRTRCGAVRRARARDGAALRSVEPREDAAWRRRLRRRRTGNRKNAARARVHVRRRRERRPGALRRHRIPRSLS